VVSGWQQLQTEQLIKYVDVFAVVVSVVIVVKAQQLAVMLSR